MDETHNPFLGEEGDPLLKKREESLQVRQACGAGRVVEGREGCGLQGLGCSARPCKHPSVGGAVPCLTRTAPAPLPRLTRPQKRLTRRDGTVMTLAQSKRANELQKDMNAWEENRLMTSGTAAMALMGWEGGHSRAGDSGGHAPLQARPPARPRRRRPAPLRPLRRRRGSAKGV